jgi:hypothetical protein
MRETWGKPIRPKSSPQNKCKPPEDHRDRNANVVSCPMHRMLKYRSNFSKEVVRRSTASSRNVSHVIGNSREDTELGVEILVNGHDGCNVTTAVAVVGGGPDSDDGVLGEVILLCCQ